MKPKYAVYVPHTAGRFAAKRFRKAQASVPGRMAPQEPAAGIKLMMDNATAKFPESAEAHIRLNIDPKYNDQQLRCTVPLPKAIQAPAGC